MKKSIALFTKGLAIGACDIVPGISGGTIALLTGVYDKLLHALKNLNVLWFYYLILFIFTPHKHYKKHFFEHWNRMNPLFLIRLGLGIIVAIVAASFILPTLLESYPVSVRMFFIGLIGASSIFLFSHIEKRHRTNDISFIVGIALGISLAFLPTTHIGTSWIAFLVGGFLAITAMLLPGVSGSYVLLIIGLYEEILLAIKSFSLIPLVLVAIGILIGFVTVSRGIVWLLDKAKDQTLSLLVGLVIGSMSVLIKAIWQEFYAFSLLFLVVGAGIVIGIHFLTKKR